MTDAEATLSRARQYLQAACAQTNGVPTFPHEVLISDLLSLVESSRQQNMNTGKVCPRGKGLVSA